MNQQPSYEELFRLYSVKKTQVEMLFDRGYIIPPEEKWFLEISNEEDDELLEKNINKFYSFYTKLSKKTSKNISPKNIIRSLLSNYYKSPKGEDIYVYFAETPDKAKQLSNDIVQLFSQKLTDYNIDRAIIISELNVSSASQNQIKMLGRDIQIFIDDQYYNELVYNPTRHTSVIKHVLLSKEKEQKILTEFGIKKGNLQAIKSTDPIVKYYNFPEGSVIELHRYDKQNIINKHTINYRVVIKGEKIES